MCQHQKGYNTFDLTINGIPVCERVEKKTCNAGYSDFLIFCQDYAFNGCARPREPSMDPSSPLFVVHRDFLAGAFCLNSSDSNQTRVVKNGNGLEDSSSC